MTMFYGSIRLGTLPGYGIGLMLMLLLSVIESNSQVPPQEVAPPPLKTISKQESERLSGTRDVKKRTQTALTMMSDRLKNAESLLKEDRHDEVFKELGAFHGLMDNTLEFLDRSDRDSNKVLNNFKRFEIGLRQFRPRLELIRREIPLNYEPYVRNLIGYLRDTRAKAVEPMFGDTVAPRTKP